ncbi:MAG: stage V sporulation protein AC [Firmicutes bacterium]|nr:stage V sporulation protein AC [Bacillota bacterium]
MEQKQAEPEVLEAAEPDKSLTPAELQQLQKYKQEQAYEFLVEQFKPRPTVLKNAIWAFVVGGLICVVGQIFLNFFLFSVGLTNKEAIASTTLVMVFIGAFLTGLGVYDELGKRAGAGSIVPITGFANSIVASAMEAKREGFVFGVGAKLFAIAGPVLVYGFVISTLIGLIVYFFQ